MQPSLLLTDDLATRQARFATPDQFQRDNALALQFLRRFAAPPPTETPFEWVCKNIVFNEPEIKGPFDARGRRYMEDPINDRIDDDVIDQTLCMGTGSAKTVIFMVGEAYEINFDPHRTLWVMPTTEGVGGASKFNTTRFQKMLEATATVAQKMPTGTLKKSCWTAKHLSIAGNVLDFGGANSPAQLAANRCRRVVCDEVDKFKDALGDEAGAIYLADERTKNVPGAKKFKSSSPSTDTGNIWRLLMESDLRRRFLACPHCNPDATGRAALNHFRTNERPISEITADLLKGWSVVVWSDQYTVLPRRISNGTEIPLITVKWDETAKRKDNTWDLDRVMESAHFLCPHCSGKILDQHRLWQDECGIWIPTQHGSPYHRGYHLPSMCAPMRSIESSVGGMVKKFLDCLSQGSIKGMINSDFAEPEVGQQHGSTRIDLVAAEKSNITRGWIPIIDVDVQQNWPYFWHVGRQWLAYVLSPDAILLPKFLETTSAEQKALIEKIVNLGRTSSTSPKPNQAAAVDQKAIKPISPQSILLDLLRFEDWQTILAWLNTNSLTGPRLAEFFCTEFQNNTLRLIEFVLTNLGLPVPRQGDSEAISIGYFDNWEDLDDIQAQLKVASHDVVVDSGWGATDNAGVYHECFKRATQFKFYEPIQKKFQNHRTPGTIPFAVNGWLPSKGFPKDKRWRDRNRIVQPYEMHIDDPFKGTSEAGRYLHYVFHFSSPYFLDELDHIRNRTKLKWAVAAGVKLTPDIELAPQGGFTLEEYYNHLRGKYKDANGIWQDKKSIPDHLYDCEKGQTAYVSYKGILPAKSLVPKK